MEGKSCPIRQVDYDSVSGRALIFEWSNHVSGCLDTAWSYLSLEGFHSGSASHVRMNYLHEYKVGLVLFEFMVFMVIMEGG